MSAQSSRTRANARRRQSYRRRSTGGRGHGGYARRSSRRGYGRARRQGTKHPVIWAVFWTALIVYMIGNNWLTITGK